MKDLLKEFSLLSILHESNSTLIVRAKRVKDLLQVVLKIRCQTRIANNFHSLHKEYALMKHIDSKYCIKAYDLYEVYSKPEFEHGDTSMKEEVMIKHTIAKKFFNEQNKGKRIFVLVVEDFGAKSLTEVLTTLSLRQVLHIAVQTTKALIDIHSVNIIHQDIKPSNILVQWDVRDRDKIITKVCDFGLSVYTPAQNYRRETLNLTGTLAYMSPEQTGRINSVIDNRSDLYSLGITLYELLSGDLPFKANDLPGWILCHLAKTPLPLPNEVPQTLANIVYKLLNKRREDRYTSAAGLCYDLKRCLKSLQHHFYLSSPVQSVVWTIKEFPLGQKEEVGHFTIPNKLYGRSDALLKVDEILDELSSPLTQEKAYCRVLFLEGEGGIGKTSFCSEIERKTAILGGTFIFGKSEEINIHRQYNSLERAFRSFMQQLLLIEDNHYLSQLGKSLFQALGNDCSALFKLIPELHLLIGGMHQSTSVSASESMTHFLHVMKIFIQCLISLPSSNISNPDLYLYDGVTIEEKKIQRQKFLVILMDDMQWIDTSTLKLFEFLFSDTEFQRLRFMLISSYRKSEVSSDFQYFVKETSCKDILVDTISLVPLNLSGVEELISDTLCCSLDIVSKLAKVCYDRTEGNPLFIQRFLLDLFDSGKIKYVPSSIPDELSPRSKSSEVSSSPVLGPIVPLLKKQSAEEGGNNDLSLGFWEVDIQSIQMTKYIKDNKDSHVLDYQLRNLPSETQRLLLIASCQGVKFSTSIISTIAGLSECKTVDHLWPAIEAGLIFPTGEIVSSFYPTHSSLSSSSLQSTSLSEIRSISLSSNNTQEGEFEKKEKFVHSHYKFLHDKILSTAYYLDLEDTANIHLQTARVMLKQLNAAENSALTSSDKSSEDESNVTDIVNHYNLGRERIIENDELIVLSHLNVRAATNSRQSAGFDASYRYAKIAIEIISRFSDAEKEKCKSQLFDAILLAGEMSYLLQRFEEGDQLLAKALTLAVDNPINSIKVFLIQIPNYCMRSLNVQAVNISLSALKSLGIVFPSSKAEIVSNFINSIPEIKQKILDTVPVNSSDSLSPSIDDELIQKIHSFTNLPLITDNLVESILSLLHCAYPPAFLLGDPALFSIAQKMISLTLNHGKCSITPICLLYYASSLVFLSSSVPKIRYVAFELGRSGINMLQDSQFSKAIKSAAANTFGVFLGFWKMSMKELLYYFTQAMIDGMVSGNYQFTAFSSAWEIAYDLSVGVNSLSYLTQRAEKNDKLLHRIKQQYAHEWLKLYYQAVYNLHESFEHVAWKMRGPVFNEKTDLNSMIATNQHLGIFIYYQIKTMLCYLHGQPFRALKYIKLAAAYEEVAKTMLVYLEMLFYSSLTIYALLSPVPGSSTTSSMVNGVKLFNTNSTPLSKEDFTFITKYIHNSEKEISNFIDNQDNDYYPKWKLLTAEKYRVAGDNWNAMMTYNEAIEISKTKGLTYVTALAYEISGTFWSYYNPFFSNSHLNESQRFYRLWKCNAKYNSQYMPSSSRSSSSSLHERNIVISRSSKGDDDDDDFQRTAQCDQSLSLSLSMLGFNNSIDANDYFTESRKISGNPEEIATQIDILSIMKASVAISSKRINEVISSLLQIVVTHMGANFALLYLRNNSTLIDPNPKQFTISHFSLRASATFSYHRLSVKQYQQNYFDEEESSDDSFGIGSSDDSYHQQYFSELKQRYPKMILQDVLKYSKSILLDNAITSEYKNEEYVKNFRPLSVYCLLLKANNNTIGVLYLENNLIPSVFTTDKLQTVKLLSSQMAISLENAQYYERMEAMNAIKDSFIATTNHELRTPLHGIIGNTSLLEETKLTDLQFEYVNSIRYCSDNLLRMVNDLLELSKIKANKMILSTKRFELINWLESTMEIVTSQAAHKHLLFLYFPLSSFKELYVEGDADKMTQVVLNLLSNAVKFTERGFVLLNYSVLELTSSDGENSSHHDEDASSIASQFVTEKILESGSYKEVRGRSQSLSARSSGGIDGGGDGDVTSSEDIRSSKPNYAADDSSVFDEYYRHHNSDDDERAGNDNSQNEKKSKMMKDIMLTIQVKDSGIGIANKHIHKLFKPFSQIDNSNTRKYGGTGLGLVIIKRICTLLGGNISVESTEDLGTTFTLSLPLKLSLPDTKHTSASSLSSSSSLSPSLQLQPHPQIPKNNDDNMNELHPPLTCLSALPQMSSGDDIQHGKKILLWVATSNEAILFRYFGLFGTITDSSVSDEKKSDNQTSSPSSPSSPSLLVDNNNNNNNGDVKVLEHNQPLYPAVQITNSPNTIPNIIITDQLRFGEALLLRESFNIPKLVLLIYRNEWNTLDPVKKAACYPLFYPLRFSAVSHLFKSNFENLELSSPVEQQQVNTNPLEKYKKLRLLIVEDNALNLKMILKMLGDQKSWIIVSAMNGLEAVNICSSQRFDIILMDVQMPIMDGLTATKELRKMGVNVPILGVSASFAPDDIMEMKKSGMTTSIGKPLRKDKLLSFLADILSNQYYSK